MHGGALVFGWGCTVVENYIIIWDLAICSCLVLCDKTPPPARWGPEPYTQTHPRGIPPHLGTHTHTQIVIIVIIVIHRQRPVIVITVNHCRRGRRNHNPHIHQLSPCTSPQPVMRPQVPPHRHTVSPGTSPRPPDPAPSRSVPSHPIPSRPVVIFRSHFGSRRPLLRWRCAALA